MDRHFGSSSKGEYDLDWTDESERRALLEELVAEAHVALGLAKKALSGHAASSATTQGLRSARALLADLLSQDKGFEGYEASVVAETDSGVILATDARAANVADRVGARDLVESAAKAAGRAVAAVLGDTAYGDTDTRRELAECGAEVIAKAPPISSKKGTFGRDEFEVSGRRGKATCPAGKSSIRRARNSDDNGWTYHSSRLDCTPCPLRERCTASKLGARTISVSARTKELDRHRRRQHTQRFRKRYLRRVVIEHAIGRLRRLGIGQARYFGASKAAMRIALASLATLLAASGRPLWGPVL